MSWSGHLDTSPVLVPHLHMWVVCVCVCGCVCGWQPLTPLMMSPLALGSIASTHTLYTSCMSVGGGLVLVCTHTQYGGETSVPDMGD